MHIKPIVDEQMKVLRKRCSGYYILSYTLFKKDYHKRYKNVNELKRDYSRLKYRYKLKVNIRQTDVLG